MVNLIISIVIILSSIILLYHGLTFNESKIKNEVKDKEKFIIHQRKFGKVVGFTGILLGIIGVIKGYNEFVFGIYLGYIFVIVGIIFFIEMCSFLYKGCKYM